MTEDILSPKLKPIYLEVGILPNLAKRIRLTDKIKLITTGYEDNARRFLNSCNREGLFNVKEVTDIDFSRIRTLEASFGDNGISLSDLICMLSDEKMRSYYVFSRGMLNHQETARKFFGKRRNKGKGKVLDIAYMPDYLWEKLSPAECIENEKICTELIRHFPFNFVADLPNRLPPLLESEITDSDLLYCRSIEQH